MWTIEMPHRLTGLLFVSFVERYKTNRQTASLPTTVYVTLKCVGAPLAAYLAEIIGIRNVTIIGCLVSSIGIGSCFYAENITQITIDLSLIYGVGILLGSSLMPQMLKLHFNKNLANAHGVTLAGACIGAIVHPPVIKYLLKEFGVSGTFLITSGIMLNGVPIAMLLHDPKYDKKEPESSGNSNEIYSLSGNGDETPDKCSTDFVRDQCSEDSVKHSRSECKRFAIFEVEDGLKAESLDAYARKTQTEVVCDNFKIARTKNSLNEMLVETRNDHSDKFIKVDDKNENENGDLKCTDKITFLGLDFKNIHVSPVQLPKENKIILHMDHHDTNSHISAKEVSQNKETSDKYKKALETFLVFKDPPFFVIMLCCSIRLYVIVFMWIILIDVSRDKSIEYLEVYYLMILPVAEIVGDSCFGWVTDSGYLTKPNFTGACFVFLGLSCAILANVRSFGASMFALGCFGVFAEATGVCSPGLVYQFVGVEKQTMAIASRYVLYAPLSYSIVPLIGYFRSTLGSYDGILYLLATLNIFSGGLMAALPCIARCTNSKNKVLSNSVTN